jgi:2-keto-4-pentenoate hydratase
LLIRDELSAPVTPDDVLTATEAVYGAIEVLESHYTDYRYKRPDVIADNVGAGAVVLGTRPRRPDELDDLGLIGAPSAGAASSSARRRGRRRSATLPPPSPGWSTPSRPAD